MITETSNGKGPKRLTEFELGTVDPHARAFKCPCCQARLQFKLNVNVFGVYELLEDSEGDERPVVSKKVDRFTVDERNLLESLRDSGVLAAFEAAAKAGASSKVLDPEAHLLTFLRRAVPVRTPQFAIRTCLPENEREGDLALWQLNTVAAVIADGQLRCFLPTDLVRGRTVAHLTTENGKVRQDEALDVTAWIKTKFGYVSGRGAMFNELRKRAVGSFDNTGT